MKIEMIPIDRFEFLARDTTGKKNYLMDLVLQSNVPDFDWAPIFQGVENGIMALACEHEIICVKLLGMLREKEKELETLRQSMESLCHEMETKKESPRTFVMGPGAEDATP